MPKQSEKYSFRTGSARRGGICYFLALDDRDSDAPFTAVFTWKDNEWYGDGLDWNAHSATTTLHPKEQLAALGTSGNVLILGQGDKLIEDIYQSGTPKDKVGGFREIREIGGYAYACGMDRQVFRRDAPNRWSRKDHGLPSGGDDVVGLESMHGFSESDIYAAGWGGEIWHYDGKAWSQIDSPTNLLLNKVLCAPDGNVYICGQCGILIRGREHSWEVIEQGDTGDDFWSLAWFNDKLYISTMQFLYALEEDELQLVEFDEDIPETCYHLSTADGVLWSIGAKDVMCFDGEAWTRID